MAVTMSMVVRVAVPVFVGMPVHRRPAYSTSFPTTLNPILEIMTTGGRELVDAPRLDCHYQKRTESRPVPLQSGVDCPHFRIDEQPDR